MSGLEMAIIITGAVVSIAGVISATIIKLRCKSGCCSVTPIDALEHGDPSLKDLREASDISIKTSTSRQFEADLAKMERIIEDSKQMTDYDESFSD